MGTVFRVRHWEWNVDLAVKAPLPNLVADWADKERLILEAHTWVDLGVHPNIVQCWFVREYDGVPLLFLDYLPGGSLRDVMVSGQVRPGQWAKILDLAIQACDGLAHAHDHGLIHRDVKPANMLIGEDGQLCVTDFGLVKVKKDEPGTGDIAFDVARLQGMQGEGDLSLTATGTVMGTPHYAAPEQWLGQNVGVQADVYAMGILLFEMCCGFRPFDLTDSTMSITHLVTCHVYQPPPDPASINPSIPESLANCIVHCLLKDPADRPQSMRELRETLANIYQEVEGRPHPRPVPRAGVQRAAALNNKAVSLWNLNKTQEAFDAWREAAKLDALHPESVYNRSILQWRLGQIDHEEVLRRLTQVSSQYKRACAYLGYYHIERHCPAEAETIMQNGISLPELAAEGAVWRTMGDARMCLEQYPTAERAYRQALQRIPEDRETQARLEMAQQKLRTRNNKIVFPLSQPRRILRRDGRVSAMAADHESLVIAGENRLEKMDLETSYTVWQWQGEGQRGEINRLALTDDFVLSLDTPDGRVWSRSTGECLHTLNDGERFYAVLPGGKQAIAGLIDLKIVNLPGCQRVKALKAHTKQVTSVAITPDGRLALSGSCDRTAKLWNLHTGELIRSLEGHKDMVDAVAISPDGTVGLSGGRDRAVRLWLLAGGDWIGTLGEHAGDVQSIKMTHDGRYAVISCATSDDNQLCVWDLQQASRLFTRHGVVAVAPDCNCMLAGTRSTRPPKVNLWEIPSGRSVRTLEGHSAGVCAVCFTPDGQLAATASENGQVQVWEIAESSRFYDRSLVVTRTHSHGEAESARQKFLGFLEQARKSTQPGQAYRQLAHARSVPGYDRDPEALALNASLMGLLPRKSLHGVWELRTFTEPSQTDISAVALTGDGRLAVSAAGKMVRLWDLSTGSCLRGFAGHSDRVDALVLCEEGRRVLSASLDKSLRLWNVQTGDCLASLTDHPDGIGAVAVTPDGRTAVSVTLSSQVHVWDLTSSQCTLTFPVGSTRALALTEDGKNLLSVGDAEGGSLRLTNLVTGKQAGFKSGSKHDSLTGTALDMTADARFALVAGIDHTVRLWDLVDGVVLRQLAGHTDRVNSLVMTEDGRFAISASDDGTVRLWDVLAASCLNVFQSHGGPVLCADMSFDGRFVLSAGSDRSFRLWELDWELDPDGVLQPMADVFPRKGLFKRVMGIFQKG